MVFPFRQIILPIALEESISETHQFWKESGSVEKFGRDSNISLSFANINAMHFFQGLCIFKTKRGKDINETLPFSSFQRIKPGNFQFCISKTTSARGCKLSKHEKILPYSIFGTLHRCRFHLSLARKLTSSFTRSCNWEEFDVL